MFRADLSVRPPTATVRLSGELDIAWVQTLRDSLDAARASGCARVVLDLSGLDFIDSSGVTELLRASDRGQVTEIVRGPGPVARTLDLMRVAPLLPLAA